MQTAVEPEGLAQAAKPPASVQTMLVWLVLACLLPGLVGAIALLQRSYVGDRLELQQHTLQTARALVLTVDAQLAQAQLLSLALSTSNTLHNKDWAAFHAKARELLAQSAFAQGIALYAANGQPLVNTRLAFGQVLPRAAKRAHIQDVLSNANPVTSDVVISPWDGQPVVSVATPVFVDSKQAYTLVVEMSPLQFQGILQAQQLDPDWVVGVMDGAGTLAARSHAPEKFVGKTVAAGLLTLLQQQAPEGMAEMTTREGIETVTPYSRSARSGWSVAIGIPRASFEAPLFHGLMALACAAALLLALGLGLARFWGGRIVGAVAALRGMAQALGDAAPMPAPALRVREAQEVGLAMVRASALLKERSQALEKAHEAMARRENELADAQRMAGIGSWTWDLGTDSTQSTTEMCVIFGLPEIPHFAQQNGLMYAHAAWRQLRQARLAMARTGQGFRLELPALRGDGTAIWVDTRGEVVRDATGEVTGLRGTVQDITQRKETESIVHSERFIRSIANALPALVAYWDQDLRCSFCNQRYLDWWGKTAEEMAAITLDALMGESLFAINQPVIRAALAGHEQHFERFLTKPDGSVGHVLATYLPDRNTQGVVQGIILVVSDIKALKLAESELRLAANVYQNTAEGIMVTDSRGTIVSVNPAFTQITGFTAQEAVGRTPRLLRSDRHDAAFHAGVWEQIATQGRWQGEIWNRRKNGEVFLEHQTITKLPGASNEPDRYVSVFHDITDTWQINEDNRHLAFHDALTQLPNRALLMERLERRIASAAREPRCIAVLFLDLDGFKAVNDSRGHAIGDELLIAVAHKLQALVRQSDTVARFGGDEFVIKLDNPSQRNEVVLIAERVIAVIHEPVEIQGQQVQVGVSVGIALFPQDCATAAELIKRADAAMYEAKRAGKNRYQFFAAPRVQDGDSAE